MFFNLASKTYQTTQSAVEKRDSLMSTAYVTTTQRVAVIVRLTQAYYRMHDLRCDANAPCKMSTHLDSNCFFKNINVRKHFDKCHLM